jgi:hypothetical protein
MLADSSSEFGNCISAERLFLAVAGGTICLVLYLGLTEILS